MTYLIIGIIALIGIGYYYTQQSNASAIDSSPAKPAIDPTPQAAPPKPKENPFLGLRQMALNFPLDQFEVKPTDAENQAYGIIMDWEVGNGIISLSSFVSGDASLYWSSGGGVIGGGQHEIVRQAVAGYLKMAQDYLAQAKPVSETPLPTAHMVHFYFLTPQGKMLGQENMANIKQRTSPWLPLFEEANKVISALRMTTEKQ